MNKSLINGLIVEYGDEEDVNLSNDNLRAGKGSKISTRIDKYKKNRIHFHCVMNKKLSVRETFKDVVR
jgi:hypothetical protein